MKKIRILAWGALVLLALQLPAWGFDGVDVQAVRKQAEQGDPAAQSKLGVLYSSGVGLDTDKKEAVRWYTRSAQQGYPLGQWNLAFMYLRGEGVPEDFAKAEQLMRAAAQQGLANAQFDLGMMYLHGVGVPADRGEADKWFRRAADQGYREAEKMLRQPAAGSRAPRHAFSA